MEIFSGKRFFVYGAGVSGKAAKLAIKKNGGKARIYSDCDGVFIPPPEKNYAGAVISPGIKPTHAVYEYCARRRINTVGEAEIGFTLAKSCGCDVVGVTGTNGKTTVTKLIADMCGGIACGNIGYPICLAVVKNTDSSPLVCELSSFQLHNATVEPKVAVITNLAPDHIDWHGSESNYYADKCNIAYNMKSGFLVLGEDIPLGAVVGLKTGAEIVRTSSTGVCDGAYVENGYFCFYGDRVCPVDYLRLPGAHNVKNALTAVAAAKCMGADNKAILAALSAAVPSPHRIQSVGHACGKIWIDDSKGTNVSACRAAVEMTDGRICLIVGGRGKGTDFTELFDGLSDRVVCAVAMGETAQDIRDCARRIAPALKVTVVNTLADAVATAANADADTVLLSPACASFDEFRNYGQRGDAFRREVHMLGKRNG